MRHLPPMPRSGPLSKRMVELIYVALDASAAHMFTRGLELHLEMAIKSGATQHDLCDVFRVVTEQGASAALASEGILAEELSAAGFNMAAPDPEFEVRRERLCARIGTSGEGLSRKEYALIRVALHGAFTSPVPDALRKAIRDALREQASAEEIRQALRMTGHLAVHACAVGLPVFEKVLTRGGVG